MSDAKRALGPLCPPEYGLLDAQAIQALMRGDATPDQQQRALHWIVEVAGMAYDETFYPGGEEGRRNSDFAAGRRFVGNQVVKLTKINLSSIKRSSEND